ncbi:MULTISPECIES: pyruvate dehydrogenase (acetyl-transferring) E1 component subunit alpha [Streptomycetaceae]|uniref:Pyruvate dehydrogenase E1 component subunit alpha n=1 Tax=Streptantibioticus cattleyicolor (strain ATCC 35852 / DSM 46488 / JCM 4925 / NBRC 14057 / NRRL 8057) TaxID=1003195 RepID=F8JTM4_STREN|nr:MULTISPECIES: pyruvate dehydrogenase (acetyl-transferring) E1 component subunit alpha [Streptomycetaceae]AEW96791.1 pyruvate dehydrogenase (lipoamide) [Streptantibioticus cattleyicolor NRRL 8057 = DSM 46488]MYS61272.1 pyruvate dehydrogenase (acetyl-transferring) E1 component subunit alpha [Streptomyces sp. SID5468]CCB77121.1 Pyruvate dehydrogenase E1 component subunit alpha [Streptantibioticus cattleyicolor NRRL 8057 = DSM 46488]
MGGRTRRGTRAEVVRSGGSYDPEDLIECARRMLLVRRFEERAAQAYTQARVGGYCHLNLGEEATVVGLTAALEPGDYLFTNYREHGYALGRGIPAGRIMAELYGRSTGVSKGWGGSMHMFDAQARLMGGYGIVGGQLPLATGAALAISYRGGAEVVMCQMGDGTTNIGAFHESLNIAALWDLPVVFAVVNNQLGMGTSVQESSAEPELHRRAAAYRINGVRVDGTDVLAVREAAREAVRLAREEHRPTLLETVSHRLRGHSVVDPARYRDPEEAARAATADPLPALRARLAADGALDDAGWEAMDAAVRQEVARAAEFAENSPHPAVETLFDHTYATPVPNSEPRLPADALFPQPL